MKLIKLRLWLIKRLWGDDLVRVLMENFIKEIAVKGLPMTFTAPAQQDNRTVH